MKRLLYILSACFSLVLFTGCLDSFRDLNTDDELLGNTDPRNVFTGATENFNNSSRGHLTGKYSGVMVYMQYLVPTGGASAGYYVMESKPNEHPQPNMPGYSDFYGSFGLRLDYLINNVIPFQGEEAPRYADVGAVSQILLSFKKWQILDTYGAAPLTEAFKAQSENILTPRYDTFQESVDGTPMYKIIDNEIKAAVETLKKSDNNQYNLGANDFFYGGDVSKWIKFGNTLRVRMAQRVEKMDAGFYDSVISEVLSSAANVMGSLDESCIYYHPNDYNNNTDDIQDITKNYCASQAFVDFLANHNDPRLAIMVRRNGFGTGNNNEDNDKLFDTFFTANPNFEADTSRLKEYALRYHGMSANPDNAKDNIFQNNAYYTFKHLREDGTETSSEIRMHSQIESRYYIKNGGIRGNNNMPNRCIEDSDFIVNQDNIGCFTPILTYPEACLMFAEIALKKGGAVAGKSADAWYREGIKASMQQYKAWAEKTYVVAQVVPTAENYNPVTDEKIDAYLARPEFQNATLEKIISQQWINLYMQPEEMWAVWKRTGLPAFSDDAPENGVAFLEKIQETEKDLVIPRRNTLPVPNSLNIANYNAAVDKLKTDAKYGSDVSKTEGRIWWDN